MMQAPLPRWASNGEKLIPKAFQIETSSNVIFRSELKILYKLK